MILYVGQTLTLCYFKFHLAHVDVGPTLALHCAPNANYQSTVQCLSTLIQCSHAVWASSLLYNVESYAAGWPFEPYGDVTLSGSSLFKTTSKVPLYLSTYCGSFNDKEDLLSIITASHDECLIDQLYKARLTEISVIHLIGQVVYGYDSPSNKCVKWIYLVTSSNSKD